MKKMLNIIAALTAVSISMSTAGVAAIAVTPTDDNVSDSNTLENGYDINNENYCKKVDSLGEKIAHEEEFVAYLNEFMKVQTGDNEDSAVTHVYEYNDDQPDDIRQRTYIFESIVPGTNKKARKFEQMSILWSPTTESNQIITKSANEISAFIEKENLKAKIVTDDEGNLQLQYDDYTNEEEVVTAFLALNKKFGIELAMYGSDMEHYDVFYDDSLLLGDANEDGVLNVRDCAYIASKLAKGEKLSDIADYNKDGKVNVRDAAAIARDLAKGKI